MATKKLNTNLDCLSAMWIQGQGYLDKLSTQIIRINTDAALQLFVSVSG